MVYEIIYVLKTPIITTSPIHLDGLLGAVHPAMHNLNAITSRSDASEVVTPPLSVDSAKIGDTWVFCCSSAEYSDDARPYQTQITKRKDGIDFYYLNGRQTPRTGVSRDRCETVYGVVCSTVSFLASTTKLNQLERNCKKVSNIGGLRKMGFGQVSGVDIVERPELSWRDCLVSGGKAIRNLPEEMVDSDCIGTVITRPPYWVHSLMRPGVSEGDPAELKQGVWLNAYRNRRTKVGGKMPEQP